jgi:hypothetical protein
VSGLHNQLLTHPFTTHPGLASISLLAEKRCVLLAKLLLLVLRRQVCSAPVCAALDASAACLPELLAASDAGMLADDAFCCSWLLLVLQLLLAPTTRLVLDANGAADGMNVRADSSE